MGTLGDAKKLLVVPKGGKGKLCGTSKTLLNAVASVVGAGTASNCTGPDLKDNVKVANLSRNENAKDDFYTQSLIVMPGCTLEVWDKDTSPESKRELWHRFLSLNVLYQEKEASGMLRRRKRREKMLAI